MRRRSCRCGLLAGALAIPGIPSAVGAQDAGQSWVPGTTYASTWRLTWSPLAPIADMLRVAPGAPPAPELLLAPAPRVGTLWTTGNPGALATDVSDSRSDFDLTRTVNSGAYRRPLDPEQVTTTTLSASAWRRVTVHAAAVGRFALGQRSLTGGTEADGMEPYSSSPLIPTDSSTPLLGRSRVSVEGALGWSVGGWGAGLAAGYEGRDSRAEHSPRGRIVRSAAISTTLGLVRLLPIANLLVGVYGRARGGAESMTIVANPASLRVYQLEGYNEVEPRDFVNGFYYRHIERPASAVGASLAGRALGADFAASAERGRMTESQSSLQVNLPPKDYWRTHGTTLRGAAQRALVGNRALVTIASVYETEDGSATRSDLPGVIYRSTESELSMSGDVRWQPPAGRWAVAATTLLRRDRRTVHDALAALRTALTAWTPGAGLEVSRSLSAVTRLSASYTWAQYIPVALVPKGEELGVVYRRLIAPETEFEANEARAQTGAVALSWRSRPGATVLLRGWIDRIGSARVGPPTPFTPAGSRDVFGLTLGVALTERAPR